MYMERLMHSGWILVVPLVLALLWAMFFGYQGLNGQDTHDYLHIAQAWSNWSTGAPRPAMVEHPHGYPVMGALLAKVLGNELVSMRAVSAFALVGLLFAVRGSLKRAFVGASMIDGYILLVLASSPFLLRYSLMVMSDVPAALFAFLTFLCALRWSTGGGYAWPIAMVACAVAAMAVRFAVAPLLMVMVIALVHGGREGRRKRWSWAVGTVAIGSAILLVSVPFKEIWRVLMASPLGEWSLLNLFRRDFQLDDGTLHYSVPNLVYALSVGGHPGFLVLAIGLWPFFHWSDLRPPHARIAAFLVVGYLLFIAGMPFHNFRMLVLVQPLLVVLLFPAFGRLVAWVAGKGINFMWLAGVVLLVQSGLFVRALAPFIHQARVEREISAQVKAAGSSMVYTHGMGGALRTYCPGIAVNELWYGTVHRFETGSLIVVDTTNLAEQWTGLPPALSWANAKHQGVEMVKGHPNGWTIARIR